MQKKDHSASGIRADQIQDCGETKVSFSAIWKDLVERDPWYAEHHRFGMAGEGQANVIEKCLGGKRGRVLNIGCGPWGAQINKLATFCKFLVAADKSWSHITEAKMEARTKRIAFLQAKAEHIPFADNSFDHILALGLFAEIPEPLRRQVFSELYRVCRPIGNVMVTNAIMRPKEQHIAVGLQVGLRLLQDHEGHCKAASGDVKLRYLLLFAKR